MTVAQRSLRAVAQTLSIDAASGEVAGAMHEQGLVPILLRGPAIARALFADDELRTYVDLDLLVSPSDWSRAATVLRGLGFAPLVEERELRGHRPVHSFEWWREADHVAVDLHRTISGVGVSSEQVWSVLEARTRFETVGGTRVRVLEPAALALSIALHAAHHGPGPRKSTFDLQRAISRLEPATWRAAATLAERLEATPALAAGLRLLPEGTALARALRLPASAPPEVSLRASGAPPLALGLDWLLRTPGLLARCRLVAHVLVPPPGALKAWRPVARHGRRGLVTAYVSQPLWLAYHLGPSLLALRRARRSAP